MVLFEREQQRGDGQEEGGGQHQRPQRQGDAQSWAIRQLVIKIGHRFSGKEVQIPMRAVDRISYPDSTVFVNLTKEAVEQSPAQQLAPVGAAD